MLLKYIIIMLTPLSIVYLSILLSKYKTNKFIMIIIILAALTILGGSIWVFNNTTTLSTITLHVIKEEPTKIISY